jgi:hypothetical protein
MDYPVDQECHYMGRKSELVKEFDESVERWRPIIARQYGSDFANTVLRESRAGYETLIPQIPYIGDDDIWTGSLVESARCLAFYEAMRRHGKRAGETGRILYDAVWARMGEPQQPIPPSQLLTPEQLMDRRKRRAESSHERRYSEGTVCEFVAGDGDEFDYGYDFTECASQKFYQAQKANEFLPFFCFLDYPYSQVFGLGLVRTMTLAEGHPKCNPRFKSGRGMELEWPPPFLKSE